MSLYASFAKLVRTLGALAIVGGVFLLLRPTYAINTVPLSPITSAMIGTSYNSVGTTNGTVGQLFTAQFSGSVNSISVPIWRYQNSGGVGALCQGVIATKGVANDTGSANLQLPTTLPTAFTNTWSQFTGGSLSTFTVTAGTSYWVYVSCGNNTQFSNTQWLGNSADFLTGQFGTSTNRGTTITPTSSIMDIPLVVDVNVTSTQIVFTSTPTSTCNFYNFNTAGSISTSTATLCGTTVGSSSSTGTCSIGVAYNAGTLDTNSYTFNNNNGTGGFNQFNFLGGANVPNPGTFVSGTLYNARAYLCDKNNQFDCYMGANGYNSHIIAQSANWQFIVNGLDTCSSTYYSQSTIPSPIQTTSSIDNFNNITFQATAYCTSFNDGSILGGVSYGICKSIAALFVPSQDSLNNFYNLKSSLQNKPPFGYYNTYNTLVSSFSNSQTASTSVASSTFDFSSTMTQFTGWSFFTTIQTIIQVLLLIAGLFYFIWRFKHFHF